MKKRLTLEEIGQIAGVSRATVSRVINNHPYISEEVRERVQQVIAETGYQPNLAARSLASNESNVLGLIIPSVIQAVFTDPYYPRLTQGIAQACNETGYTLSLFLFHSEEEDRTAVNRIVGNSLLDGVIVHADNMDDPFIPALIQNQVPFVQIGRPYDPSVFNYVDSDNFEGAYIATKHLIDHGFQRIGHISTARNVAGVDREAGYMKAMTDHNREVDRCLVAYGDFTEVSGYTAMKQLLPHKPDAVFVQSDGMALGALRAIREADLSVPDDIAIVGFDDLPPALQADPPLTTIRQDINLCGQIAVKTLIDIIKTGPTPPRHNVLPVELVIRESCGTKS